MESLKQVENKGEVLKVFSDLLNDLVAAYNLTDRHFADGDAEELTAMQAETKDINKDYFKRIEIVLGGGADPGRTFPAAEGQVSGRFFAIDGKAGLVDKGNRQATLVHRPEQAALGESDLGESDLDESEDSFGN